MFQAEIFSTPTISHTATPDAVSNIVNEVLAPVEISGWRFLSLSVSDWVELAVSVVYILAAVFLLNKLVYYLLKRLAKLTPVSYDEEFLRRIRKNISQLVILFVANIAVERLQFLTPQSKHVMVQILFSAIILVFSLILWKLVVFIREQIDLYYQKISGSNNAESVFVIAVSALKALIIFVSAVVVLNHWGVNVNALLAAMGIGGLAVSLAAQETLSNIISGVMIIIDKPFRIGDRIAIQEMDTWGDVITIGLRSTRIRMLDNRTVIVPNSKVSSGRIVNYTYPDPYYRDQCEITVAYSADLEMLSPKIQTKIYQIPGVLSDRPIDVLLWGFSDTGKILRIRWWLGSYTDARKVIDLVNRAVYEIVRADDVESSYPPIRIVDLKQKDNYKSQQETK